jgi:tRNA threonylcarbamoyladenosine biosynthesis protein TsaB
MLLLAVDTTGRQGSIALALGNADGRCEVIEVVPLEGGTFSAQLIPQVAALLSKHGFQKNDLGGFVAASGPGSFTGIRVGLAAIKALGEATGKPIAAVSLLQAVALAGGLNGKVFAALDAGRQEVYVGEYEVTGHGARMILEKLVTRTELLEMVKAGTVTTPDKWIDEVASAVGIRTVVIDALGSGAIARLGWTKILSGEVVYPEALEANYIRRTDAEIFSKNAS